MILGFAFWLSNYKEMLFEDDANKLASDFVAKKIRQRVNDPETADTLIPKNHGFGTRRVPMETSYYEAYNRPNVRLIDLSKTPIERITDHGLGTTKEDFKFDMIIYATGFDAVTGAFDAIDFEGVGGEKLLNKWAEGPKTYLGMTVRDFPNMFMVCRIRVTGLRDTAANRGTGDGPSPGLWKYSQEYRACRRLDISLHIIPRGK